MYIIFQRRPSPILEVAYKVGVNSAENIQYIKRITKSGYLKVNLFSLYVGINKVISKNKTIKFKGVNHSYAFFRPKPNDIIIALMALMLSTPRALTALPGAIILIAKPIIAKANTNKRLLSFLMKNK